MALATQDDVTARVPRDLTDTETTILPAWLDDASALVVGWVGADFIEPYPDPVVGVVAQMVVRALLQGSTTVGVEEEHTGPFGRRFTAAATGGGPWLSAADKIALRPYRRGVTSVQLVSERYTIS